MRDRLALALAPCRNREAAFALAVFLGRYWSTPARILAPFPIDRRALADRADLGLSEARVRGAIRALEAVGFLDRTIPAKGSRHKLTAAGELHRKPVLYQFGGEYGPAFLAANRRAKARDRQRKTITPVTSISAEGGRLPSTDPAVASVAISPKSRSVATPVVFMGEIVKQPSPPAERHPGLEHALEKWRRAAEGKWRT